MLTLVSPPEPRSAPPPPSGVGPGSLLRTPPCRGGPAQAAPTPLARAWRCALVASAALLGLLGLLPAALAGPLAAPIAVALDAAPAAAPRHNPPGLPARNAKAEAPAKVAGAQVAKDIARILARGELVVAMLGTDSPPFFYERDQRLQGIDVTMAQDIGAALGVPVRIDRSPASFNAVVELVSRGEADLGISKLSRTLGRAKNVLFSDPYVTLRHSLLLNRSEFAKLARKRTAAATMQDFKGTLGVIADSSFFGFATANFPLARIHQYPGWDEVVAAIRSGEVVAGYRDEFEVKRVLAESPALSLSLRSITLDDRRDAISIAVGSDAVALHAFVNLFLASRKTRLDIDAVLKALPPVNQGSKP
jgi:polar amino acid transport system substrate-binding protein